MTQEPIYAYDKEVELNENILLRFNRAEQRAIGLTLMDFSILVERTNMGPRSFPLTGLADLDPDWQEMVLDMIERPPVNQILKLQPYTPSFIQSMPTTIVERPAMLAFA